MTVIGLLITKDDHAVIGEWCREQLSIYDAVVCLDGSGSTASEHTLRRYGGQVVYLHESDFAIPYKTDHGLRRIAHQQIVHRFGIDNWVMCCHADEFCYHDPRKASERAEAEDFDLVSWYSLQFYPHPEDLIARPGSRGTSVREKCRHYHWSFRGSGLPWVEDRLYRNGPRVVWDQVTHGNVRPHGVSRPAPFRPALCHYKVLTLDSTEYERSGGSSFYRSHWQGLEHRTGLPFEVNRPEDLFVASIPEYDRCDRFDGTFPHAWNIGEEYRPSCVGAEPSRKNSPAD